ncbi:putative pectate lyase 11 [Abeliophyllum distichum]|uniref:Pectate lyase n=1 Tax=Abeliophyllum distichum TaxID=126358 RepID=A0ABD1SHM3_9LAMI
MLGKITPFITDLILYNPTHNTIIFHSSLHNLLKHFPSRGMKMSGLAIFFILLTPSLVLSSSIQDPELVVQDVHRSINESRRSLSYLSCGTGNPIDDCWRCNPDWERNRQRLADCAIGFGKNAVGGRDGRLYVVTDSGDDNPTNPVPGTLRHAVIQDEPLWIIFKRDMVIQLKQELVMNKFKTIDGRGASVHIAGGPCIKIHDTNNIIIHGIHIHDCKRGGSATIRDSPQHVGRWEPSDGDGVAIFASSNIWIDHCSLSNCEDGLIDAIHGSTAITVSNNYFTHHDKVMLLGHSDYYTDDKNMQVTVAFNHFGEGLVQRMPRCRHGYFHVVNNDYTHWEMYAIGGSASPTINSQGNRFLAPNEGFRKEVTKHEDAPENEWRNWNWRSEGDLMLNGAYFRQSGAGASSSTYARASSLGARPSSLVGSITTNAGALTCRRGSRC